jgi:hypothetical protein
MANAALSLEDDVMNAAVCLTARRARLRLPGLLVRLGAIAWTILLPCAALADRPVVLGDLEPLSPQKLSKEQLEQLMPGAKMSRVSASTGSTHFWTNGTDGSFVVSTDDRSRLGSNSLAGAASGSTTPGKWHVSPDGRYCVTIEWRKVPTEDWCRYVFKTSEGHFISVSDKDRAAKVFRLSINGS